MTGGSATQPAPAAQDRRGWRSTLGDPAIVAIVVYAGLAILALIAAYLAVFTVWAGYDDEGTVLVTLQAFAQGNTLYADIYSPYGPFYFELFGGLLALTGEAVTTDLSRTTVAVLWVATSLLFGLATQRLTGRVTLGAAGMIVSFASLNVLANEPMHPQVLCVFLLGAFVLLCAFGAGRRPLWAGVAGGALLAALFMTKLNLGAYAVGGVALAAALTFDPLRRRRWLSWPVLVATLLLPTYVASRDLDLDWVRDLVAVETLSLAAIIVAAFSLDAGRERARGEVASWLIGAVGGFAAALAAILIAIFLSGSSPADVYGSTVIEAMRVRDVLLSVFPMAPAAVDWAVVAVAAAVLGVWLRRVGADEKPTLWPGLIRVLAGLAIWFSVAKAAPLALNPTVGNPVALGAVLAWMAVIPPAGVEETPFKRFLRVLLPALAVLEMLQVYPVAGSQVGIASLTFVPVGALLLADGLVSLRAWSKARGGSSLQRFQVVVAVATLALAADLALNSILRPIATNGNIYADRQAAPLPGASQLHMPEMDAANYTVLVDLLHRHRCTDFIGYPNVNSLYLWSGIEPPPPVAPGAWIEALDTERQQRVVDALRASPRPCAIRNDEVAGGWLGGEPPPPDASLVRYLRNEFKSVEEVGPFRFMLPVDGGR